MNVYRCTLLEIIHDVYGYRARVIMHDDHKGMGGLKGDNTVTSPIQTIDFNNGIIVTKNSMYMIARSL